MNTIVKKTSARGSWQATTSMEIPGSDEHRLKVLTYAQNGAIRSTARLIRREPSGTEGIFFEHFMMFNGFSRGIVIEQARATEKAVREQHERALNVAKSMIEDVIKFLAMGGQA